MKRHSSTKSPPLSGGATSLVFSMMIRQSGTRSDEEVTSYVSSISVPLANDSLTSLASAFSKASDGDSEHSRFDDVVIVALGATCRIANYDC